MTFANATFGWRQVDVRLPDLIRSPYNLVIGQCTSACKEKSYGVYIFKTELRMERRAAWLTTADISREMGSRGERWEVHCWYKHISTFVDCHLCMSYSSLNRPDVCPLAARRHRHPFRRPSAATCCGLWTTVSDGTSVCVLLSTRRKTSWWNAHVSPRIKSFLRVLSQCSESTGNSDISAKPNQAT